MIRLLVLLFLFQLTDPFKGCMVLGIESSHLSLEFGNATLRLLTGGRCRFAIPDTPGFLTPQRQFFSAHLGNDFGIYSRNVPRLFLDTRNLSKGVNAQFVLLGPFRRCNIMLLFFVEIIADFYSYSCCC